MTVELTVARSDGGTTIRNPDGSTEVRYYQRPYSLTPPNTNQNADFFDRGQGGNPLGSTPVNTTIDASTLNQAQPLNLPTAPVDTNNYAGIIQSVPSVADITKQIQGTSQTEQSQQGLAQRLLSSLSKLGGRKEAQLQAEQQVGLPQFQTQLTDVNNQLQSLQKEALAIPLQLQQDVQGRGVTTGGLAPIQTGQLRQNAIKSLTLSAIAQTLQGNIANAQAQADRAVELEFAPLEAEVETLKQAYIMNKDFLEREDKKKADALNFQIQERTRVLNEQKDDKKTVLGFVAEAAKNGAPTLLLQRASEMASPSQALSMLSQYMSDPLAKEQALADLAYKRAQTASIYEDIQLKKDELKKKYSNESGKPLTDAQATSLGYAQRIAQASEVIDRLGGQFTGAGSYIGRAVPNILKSEDRQLFEQAQRNFINAVLRKESGAVISPEEFENARQQYFPQPGDTLSTLQQKKQNRETIYQNFLRNAGNPPALTQQSNNTVQVEGKSYVVGQVYQDASGKKWVVDAQGNWSQQ